MRCIGSRLVATLSNKENKIMTRSRYLTPKYKARLPANREPGQERSKMRGWRLCLYLWELEDREEMGEATDQGCFVFLFLCIERRAEIRKCSLLVLTIKLGDARGEERWGERKSWWFGHLQDSGEEILEMKCFGGRLRRKCKKFQTSKCPKYRKRSPHGVKRGKLRVSI